MKRKFIAAILMMPLALAVARPVLPPAGYDALYPAYLPLPPDRVLIIGGEGPDATANDAISELQYSRPTATASWTARGALAVLRREPEIAVFPGTSVVAIVGGRSAAGKRLSAIETFDHATGARALLAAKLPSGLVHHQVVPCGTGPRVLVIGGDDGGRAIASLTVIELDAATPKRSTVAPLRDASRRRVILQTARIFASAAALDDTNTRLLVAGGETRGGSVLGDGEIIEVTADCMAQRIRATQPLPEPRTRGALARSAGEAIYFAGWNGESLALATFAYDAKTNAWRAGAPLPTGYGRMRPPHAVKDGMIAIAGGDIGAPRGEAISTDTWTIYFPENGGEWTPGNAPQTMQRPRVGNVLAFLDGALITVFGKNTTSPEPFAGLDRPE
jgi:hypothetical protein